MIVESKQENVKLKQENLTQQTLKKYIEIFMYPCCKILRSYLR